MGLADDSLALVQHGTRLYLLNIQALSHDMFYQQVIRLGVQYKVQLLDLHNRRELQTLTLQHDLCKCVTT